MKKLGCLIIVGAFVLIGIIVGVSGGGGDSKSPSVSHATEKPKAVASDTPSVDPTVAPSDSGPTNPPIQNGDWVLQSIRVNEEDFLNDFEGSARVTYTGQDPQAENAFTVTVFKGGKNVATLTGFANGVAPGSTVTVDLISSDDYVTGPYLYDFQNDW